MSKAKMISTVLATGLVQARVADGEGSIFGKATAAWIRETADALISSCPERQSDEERLAWRCADVWRARAHAAEKRLADVVLAARGPT